MGCNNSKDGKPSDKTQSDQGNNKKRSSGYKDQQQAETNFQTPQKAAEPAQQQQIEKFNLEKPQDQQQNQISESKQNNQGQPQKLQNTNQEQTNVEQNNNSNQNAGKQQYKDYNDYLVKNNLENNDENLKKFKEEQFRPSNSSNGRRQTMDLPNFQEPPALQKLRASQQYTGNDNVAELPEKLQNNQNKEQQKNPFQMKNRLSLKASLANSQEEKDQLAQIQLMANQNDNKDKFSQGNENIPNSEEGKKPKIGDFNAVSYQLKFKDKDIRRRQFSSRQYEYLNLEKQADNIVDFGMAQKMGQDVWNNLDNKEKKKLINQNLMKDADMIPQQAPSKTTQQQLQTNKARRYSCNPDVIQLHQFSLVAKGGAEDLKPQRQSLLSYGNTLAPEPQVQLQQDMPTRGKRKSQFANQN